MGKTPTPYPIHPEDSDHGSEGADQYFFQRPSNLVAEPGEIWTRTVHLGETKDLFGFMGYNQADVAELMEVDPSTLVRWKKEDRLLTRLLTKTVMDMDKIIAKGIRIFGSEKLLSDWLQARNHALGDQRPADLMRNPYGLELVDEALDAMSWGVVL